MKQYMRSLLVVSTLLSFATQAFADGDPVRRRIDTAIETVKPALVQIHVVRTAYAEGREIKRESTGSGTIITPEGHVITNHHVAAHAARIFCMLPDKETLEADLVGTDPLSDIAVLKLRTTDRQFPYAEFGDTSSVRVGDRVLAMGSPVSLSQSVTLGIVSNIGMTLPRLLKKGRYRVMLDGEDVGTFVLWIAHDAAIFPGSSGGPLVDLSGKIVGINEIGIGLGGAIPADIAKKITAQIMTHGRVLRSWTGWEVQPLLKGSQPQQGILVSGVAHGSPAEKSGFLPGDIIRRIADRPVNVSYPEELPLFNRLEASLPVGESVAVDFVRNNQEKQVAIIPKEREPARSQTTALKQWGMTVQTVSPAIRREMKRNDPKGVLITSIRAGGPGGDAKPALRRGDILVDVDHTSVATVSKLIAVTERITEGKTDPVPALVTFERGAKQYVTVVNIGIRDLQDQGLEATKAWLPVSTQVITRDLSRMLDSPAMTGVRVTQVYAGTEAEKAGLLPGDLILKIDDEPVLAAYPEDYDLFPNMIRNYRIGSVVNLSVQRGDKHLTLPVKLVRSPRLAREMAKYRNKDFEFTVRDLTFHDKAENQWEETQHGVWVEEVTPGSWAALAELSVGDIILEVDGKVVADVSGFKADMNRIDEMRPDIVVFHVLRGVHHIFLELASKWE